MKITIKGLTEKAQREQNDWDDIFRMDIDGEQALLVFAGEPEDNTLFRDLNFVYRIPDLMKHAYEAGKKGEKFEVKQIKLDDKEEIWE